jgi:hypothetical protein
MSLVEVTWQDIIQDSSWSGAESVECPVIRSVGWLAHEDKKVLKIGGTMSQEGEISAILAIPKGCVLSCRTIDF